jgi:pantoate kinase
MSVDELVHKSLEQLVKTPTHEGLLRQAVSVAVEVHALAQFSDDEKKAIILDILKQAVQKSALSEEVKKELSNCLKTAVPATLDIAVSASRGEFSLKKPTVSCFFALFRSCLAAVPLDPKLKEMASAGLNKAEGLATAVESGKDVVAAVSGEAKDVVKEALAEALPVPPAALAEKVAEVLPASPVVQSVGSIGSEPAIGILIVSAPPVAAAETVAAETVAAETIAPLTKDEPPPEVQVVVEEPKTEDVQDWGAAK